jgi:hypothetical protein
VAGLKTLGPAAAVAVALAGCGGDERVVTKGAPSAADELASDVRELRAIRGFTPHWLGDRFRRHRLGAVSVVMGSDQPGRGTMLQYGPLCTLRCRDASAGVHTTDDPYGSVPRTVRVYRRRGVPALIAPRGRYGVLLTGRYTLHIGARNRATLERAFAPCARSTAPWKPASRRRAHVR